MTEYFITQINVPLKPPKVIHLIGANHSGGDIVMRHSWVSAF